MQQWRYTNFCLWQGIKWVLEYYYRGVASWTWFYPHHYAPMTSDMVNISDFKVEFEYGKPFLPFQQLLSVLPSASCKLLPAPYQVTSIHPFMRYWHRGCTPKLSLCYCLTSVISSYMSVPVTNLSMQRVHAESMCNK